MLPLFNSSFIVFHKKRKKKTQLFHSKLLVMTQLPRMKPVAPRCRELEKPVTISHFISGTERETCLVIPKVTGNEMVAHPLVTQPLSVEDRFG